MTQEYKFNLRPREVPKIETQHRRICTRIPVPESLQIINRSLQYEPYSMNHQLPVVWDRAVDYKIFDPYGNQWIDFSSGIFVTNTGHGNPELVRALREIIDKPLLNNYYYHSEIRSLLAEQLIRMAPSGMDKVFLLTTGSETTECAVKICRMHGMKKAPEKLGILAFENSFHGKTMGAQTISGKTAGKKWIGTLDPAIYHLPYPTDPMRMMEEQNSFEEGAHLFERDIRRLEEQGIDPNSLAGIIFEPYQGWGALFFPQGYMKAMEEFARKHDILLISDEVQAGFGRTGLLFGYQHYGIQVDAICCGKAISGALPLSAVISRAELIDVDASLNSTHGGSPLPCASALANLKYLEEHDLIREAARKSAIIEDRLHVMRKKYGNIVKSFHGKGMAYAVMVVKEGTDELDIEFVERVIEKAFEKGLMSIRTMTGTIKLGPPLTIPDDALVEGIAIIDEAIAECLAAPLCCKAQ